MTDDDVDRIDRNRRHFLTVATVVTGVAGAGVAAIPFLSSLKPSARAQALGAPVEVPLGSIQPGEMVRVLWRGKLIFVLRRDERMLATLPDIVGELRDLGRSWKRTHEDRDAHDGWKQALPHDDDLPSASPTAAPMRAKRSPV